MRKKNMKKKQRNTENRLEFLSILKIFFQSKQNTHTQSTHNKKKKKAHWTIDEMGNEMSYVTQSQTQILLDYVVFL